MTQVVSITLLTKQATSTDTSEFYTIYINNTPYTVNASNTTTYTPTTVLNLLSQTISSSIVTSTVSGTSLIISGIESGTLFNAYGISSDESGLNFEASKMINAPKLFIISGTPSLTSVTTLTSQRIFNINPFTFGARCETNLVTYTIAIIH